MYNIFTYQNLDITSLYNSKSYVIKFKKPLLFSKRVTLSDEPTFLIQEIFHEPDIQHLNENKFPSEFCEFE